METKEKTLNYLSNELLRLITFDSCILQESLIRATWADLQLDDKYPVISAIETIQSMKRDFKGNRTLILQKLQGFISHIHSLSMS